MPSTAPDLTSRAYQPSGLQLVRLLTSRAAGESLPEHDQISAAQPNGGMDAAESERVSSSEGSRTEAATACLPALTDRRAVRRCNRF